MYQFIKISKNNLHDLVPLFKNAFKFSPNLSDISIKFNTKEFGTDYLGFITYFEENFPVSYYGVFPLRASINKSSCLIAQSGDTMTHSDHLGRGLFIKGAQLTYQLCSQNKISGVFGFPSKSSYSTFKKKLQWEFIDKIQNYSFFIPTLPLSLLFSKHKNASKIYHFWIRFILLFYEKGNIFNNNLANTEHDYIYHDEIFWNYKLKNNKNYLIKINNVDIVIKIDGKLSIGDMSDYNTPHLRKILTKLKLLSFLTFNFKMNFYSSRGTLADIKFSNIAKSVEGLPIGYLNLNEDTSLQNLKFTYFDFDTF